MVTGGSSVQERGREALRWVIADRLRIFTVLAVGALAGMGLCLLVPHWFFKVMGTMLAFVAAALGILALGTWWASREGLTDRTSPWDVTPDEGADLEDVFKGFQGIRDEAMHSSRDHDGSQG